MTNQEPTSEQEREFWERYGFTYFLTPSGWVWVYPDGLQNINLPPIDLNNLFKYPVPVLIKEDWVKAWKILGDWIEEVASYDSDPALALFWAVWQVKETYGKA